MLQDNIAACPDMLGTTNIAPKLFGNNDGRAQGVTTKDACSRDTRERAVGCHQQVTTDVVTDVITATMDIMRKCEKDVLHHRGAMLSMLSLLSAVLRFVVGYMRHDAQQQEDNEKTHAKGEGVDHVCQSLLQGLHEHVVMRLMKEYSTLDERVISKMLGLLVPSTLIVFARLWLCFTSTEKSACVCRASVDLTILIISNLYTASVLSFPGRSNAVRTMFCVRIRPAGVRCGVCWD